MICCRWLLLCFLHIESYETFKIHSSYKSYKDKTWKEDIYYKYLSACHKRTSGALHLVKGKTCDGDNQVALGRYRNAVNESGWGILEVETFESHDPFIQAYAAGLVEGALTKQQIHFHYRNTVESICKGYKDYCLKLYYYLERNLRWIEDMIRTKSDHDLYWKHINLTFAQLTGISDGYSHKKGHVHKPSIILETNDVYLMQLSGEFIDLEKFFGHTHLDSEVGKCSGFVKLAPENRDLFFAHVSMSGYNTMNRILKLYKFAYDEEEAPGHIVSMSSYPAALASLDDFVLSSSGLAAIETTFAIFNRTLYSDEYIRPEGQLHCWLRSIIASRLAKTGKEWTQIFALYNSGTYNNQWTVVDYKLFKPGEQPPTGLLWILEQAPGWVIGRDMTTFLVNNTYWPSYNIPYFKEMNKYSGFEEKGKMHDWFKWGSSPRAKIFNRDYHKVTNIIELGKLMRYNDYKHDEFSRCKCVPPYTAEGGISTRGDLNPANGTYEVESMGHRNHGGIDYKGTNSKLFKKLNFRAWGGPTYDPLPVFSWDTTDIKAKHYGQPTVWRFGEIETKWECVV